MELGSSSSWPFKSTGGLPFRSQSTPNFPYDPENPNSPASRRTEIAQEDTNQKIHVAVGKCIRKDRDLLHWTFGNFKNREICLLHVHQPSSSIPTLLGKLPAIGANEEVVYAHRREEREQANKLLKVYWDICSKAQWFDLSFTINMAASLSPSQETILEKHVQELSINGDEPPLRYIRLNKDDDSAIDAPLTSSIPIIDLNRLSSSEEREGEMEKLRSALGTWGFFQAVGHVIPSCLLVEVRRIGKEFFDLPMEEKDRYSIREKGYFEGYGSDPPVSENQLLDWSDRLYLLVKADIVSIEIGQVHKGIVKLVKKHEIRKLVMGAVPANFMKVDNSSSKAKYAAKYAPPFCEIWFINKGRHFWTRNASEYQSFWPPVLTADETAPVTRLSFRNEVVVETNQVEVAVSITTSGFLDRVSQAASSSSSSSAASAYTYDDRESLDCISKVEEEKFYHWIFESMRESESSKKEAFAEFLKRKKFESESVEAINKVKAIEDAHASEVQRRKEVEDTLSTIRQEQEKVLKQIEEVSRELQLKLREVAVLRSRVNETTWCQNEVAKNLRDVEMSLENNINEQDKIHQQKERAMRQIEWWKNHGQAQSSTEYTEFSLSDLQTATCNFSESFKIGQGGYGCVYKGEILDRSVAVKKLHPFNMQGKVGFQHEVQVLSKLKHPNLVTLIGTCPEAWSLVYEYLPNGSLQKHLFDKTNTHTLTWKMRTRIAADISNALLYLHSSNPEKVVHGDLKPENILFDSEFNCKISDSGNCRLVPEEIARCPSFRGTTETKNIFPYRDPELAATEVLTPKSDIYAFGIIILQLITGRPPMGLVTVVRRAVLCGNMASVLDTSACKWPIFAARWLAELGLKCCQLRSQDRPELKPTIVRQLERLYLNEEQPVPSFFLCPISQEIMHDPYVAADGFTYEGEAISGWLKNGHETSPRTNSKLSHSQLTPNHALRLAIQHWLRSS